MPVAMRAGIALMTGGVAAVGLGYAGAVAAAGAAYAGAAITGAAPAWAPWLLAIGGSAATVGLFVLGAATRRVLSRGVAILLGLLFLVLAGSFGLALAMHAREGAGGPLLLGLPLRLAIVFYGVGFVPLLALPLAHALTFRAGGGADDRDDAPTERGRSRVPR